MSSSDVARLVLGYLTDQGLEQTKSVFYEECSDIQEDDFTVTNWVDDGQKLSLIIEEYFKLKGHDKKSKRDPESILLLLWKQFDALVCQLKYSSMNAVNSKTKHSATVQRQGVRVRELNRQQRATYQRKMATKVSGTNPRNRAILPSNLAFMPNSVLPPNPEFTSNVGSIITDQQISQNGGAKGVSGPSTPVKDHVNHSRKIGSRLPRTSINTTVYFQQPQIQNNDRNIAASLQHPYTPYNNTSTATHATLQGNLFTQIVQSCSNNISSGSEFIINDQIISSEQFKSPKRKSVQPKRRHLVTDGGGKKQTATAVYSPVRSAVTILSPQDDFHLDVSSLVEKILGEPKFSEKLAENINLAVELDIPSNQKQPTAESSVDSAKVNNIMEMMTTDPAFEQLFSNFESFTNNCDAFETNVIENIQTTSQNASDTADAFIPRSVLTLETLQNANLATDALLLLANSPAKFPTKPHESSPSTSLQTPQKYVLNETENSSAVLASLTSNCFPVYTNPGVTKSPRIQATILSHTSPGMTKSPRNQTTHPILSLTSPGISNSPINQATMLSHIRQLDFTGMVDRSMATVKESHDKHSILDTTRPFTSCISFQGVSPKSAPPVQNVEVNSAGDNLAPVESLGEEVISDKVPRGNDTLVEREDVEVNSGGDTPVERESVEEKVNSSGDKVTGVRCSFGTQRRINVVGYKRIAQCRKVDEVNGEENDKEGDDNGEENVEARKEQEKEEEGNNEEEANDVHEKKEIEKEDNSQEGEENTEEKKLKEVENNRNKEKEEDKEELCSGASKNISATESEECSLTVLEELATIAFSQQQEDANEPECLQRDMKGILVVNEDNKGDAQRDYMKDNVMRDDDNKSPVENNRQCHQFTEKQTTITPLIQTSIEKSEDCRNTVAKISAEGQNDISDPVISKNNASKENVKEQCGDLSHQTTPLANVTDPIQAPKRKLKKNKRSNGTSKKRRTLPVDLDVDKFLSRLHYADKM